MKVALFSEFFLDNKNANAYCSQMLVSGLESVGIAVDIFTINNDYNSKKENVIALKSQESKHEVTKGYIIKKHIQNIRLIPTWPLETPEYVDEMMAAFEEKNKGNNYDGIIAVHKSYLSVYICEQIKSRYPNITFMLYLLDPIANSIDRNLGLRRFLFPLVERAEIKAFSEADYVIHMNCNKTLYEGSRFNKYRDKFKYADFPLISMENITRKISQRKDTSNNITMVYFGTLSSIYRSPEYVIKVIEELSSQISVHLYLYTKGDCIELFKNSTKDYLFSVSGFLNNNELEKKIAEFDFIVNIGNAMSSMLPSKVIEMMMYGKPIISFSKQDLDPCDEYMIRYKHALIIKEREDISMAAKKIKEFVEIYRSVKEEILPEEIISSFKANTPEYSGRIVKNILVENKHEI